MPLKRVFKREYRSRAVEWAVIYTLYFFMALGLIVASAITIRYGNGFFNDAAANAATANGASGTASDGSDGSDGTAAQTPAQALASHRRAALIEAGVVGSIGLASGIVALVLNLASFAVQTLINSRWDSTADKRKIFGSKLYAGLLIFAVNVILFGGNIALTWGFAQASTDVSRWTIGTDAATPAYLHAAAVMSGLVAFFALATAVADYLSLRSAEKELDAHLEPTQRRELKIDTGNPVAKTE